MKTILILFISILIMSCNAQQNENKDTKKDQRYSEESPYKIFTDKGKGYEIIYPSYWKFEDKTNDNHMIRADIYKDNNVGLQIRWYSISGVFNGFIDSYIQSFIQEMQGHWKGSIKEEKREFKTIAGKEACWVWIYAEKENGERWLFKEYLYKNGTNIIAFQSGVLRIYQDTYEKELDAIANSMKFLK
ncbi:MAG: hypothetical protein K8S23_00815 [Candidatus Cloacimonetes bacterium]|nr:hypothetical protein [Candidatus Cloacimonadota bacterium]